MNIQKIRLFLYLVFIATIVRAAQQNQPIVIGNCIINDFPQSLDQEGLFEGLLIKYPDPNILIDMIGDSYPVNRDYPFFNKEFLRDKMGGNLEHCQFVLDQFMAARNEPFYARVYEATLGNLENVQIILSSTTVGDANNSPGEYIADSGIFALKVLTGVSKTVAAQNFKNIINHEMIHGLFAARKKISGLTREDGKFYFSAHQDKFDHLYTSATKGFDDIRRVTQNLHTYRKNPEKLNPTQTEEIEKLIILADETAQKNGMPIFEIHLPSEAKEFVWENKKCVGFRSILPDGVVWEKRFKFHEKPKKQNHYASYEDVLATYLEIFSLHESAIKKYYKEDMDNKNPEEFFTYTFSVSVSLAKYFFKDLAIELEATLNEINQNTFVKRPVTRQWDHPIHFHPNYLPRINILSGYAYNAGSLQLNTADINGILKDCKLALDSLDKSSYCIIADVLEKLMDDNLLTGDQKTTTQLLLADTLQKIINDGLSSGVQKTSDRLRLADTLFAQNKKMDAYPIYHRAAKAASGSERIAFTGKQLDRYQETVALANKLHKNKSGDENMIARLYAKLNSRKRMEF